MLSWFAVLSGNQNVCDEPLWHVVFAVGCIFVLRRRSLSIAVLVVRVLRLVLVRIYMYTV
jgi:hypothetical protein